MLSLIRMGIPCSGPRGPLDWRSASSESAMASASWLSSITEFSPGPLVSMSPIRSMYFSASERAVYFPAFIASLSSASETSPSSNGFTSRAGPAPCDARASEGSACDATPILSADARKCRRPSLLDLSFSGPMAGRSFHWSAIHLVSLGGLEPPTSPLSGARSSHLSYRPTRDDATNNANNSTTPIRSCSIVAGADRFFIGPAGCVSPQVPHQATPPVIKSMLRSELVQSVERGNLVGFSQCGVVEDGVAEVLNRATVGHDGLADVDDLGCALPENVHAQKLAGMAIKQQLQHAGFIAQHHALGEFVEFRDTHFVGNPGCGQFFLRLADGGNLRDGVDPVREKLGHVLGRRAEYAATGQAALLHGSARKGREADDIACSVNMRHVGLVIGVDFDFAARINRQGRRFQSEYVAIGLADPGV